MHYRIHFGSRRHNGWSWRCDLHRREWSDLHQRLAVRLSQRGRKRRDSVQLGHHPPHVINQWVYYAVHRQRSRGKKMANQRPCTTYRSYLNIYQNRLLTCTFSFACLYCGLHCMAESPCFLCLQRVSLYHILKLQSSASTRILVACARCRWMGGNISLT